MGDQRRERLVFWRYVAAVALLYAAFFSAVFAYGGPPATGPLETVALIIGGSAAMAWLGTMRAMDITPPGKSRYFAPSLIHGMVLLVMGIAAATS